MEIKVWNDFCVPHCYTGEVLLLKAINELDLENKVTVRLKTFELDPTFPKGQTIGVPECVAKKYGCSMEEGLEKIEYASMLGREAGIDMRFKTTVFCNMRDAHRLLKYVEHEYGNEAALKFNFVLMDAYFTKNLILDDSILIMLASENGYDVAMVKEVLKSDLYLEEVLADEKEALRQGIHSIPCFVFDDKYIIRGSMSLEGFKDALSQILNNQTK